MIPNPLVGLISSLTVSKLQATCLDEKGRKKEGIGIHGSSYILIELPPPTCHLEPRQIIFRVAHMLFQQYEALDLSCASKKYPLG